MLKSMVAGASALTLGLALAASAAAADAPVYGVLMKTLSNPFWGAMEQGVRDGAKEAGVDVAFHIGGDNEAAGAKGADYVAETLGKDSKGPVLVVEGLSGDMIGLSMGAMVDVTMEA